MLKRKGKRKKRVRRSIKVTKRGRVV